MFLKKIFFSLPSAVHNPNILKTETKDCKQVQDQSELSRDFWTSLGPLTQKTKNTKEKEWRKNFSLSSLHL